MELRPTTDGDLPALYATFVDAISTVFEPRGFAAPSPSVEGFSILQRHVLATGVGYVAEEEGEVAGFGSAWTRGDDWFLACLFVRGRAQGHGLGPMLLDAVWGEAGRRRTVTDAIQPVSNVLYGRRGLAPVTPLLTFTGVPRLDAHAEEAPADISAIDEIAYGFDRTIDHRYWELHARRTEWGNAYSYAFPGGDIGPVAGRDACGRGRRARCRACAQRRHGSDQDSRLGTGACRCRAPCPTPTGRGAGACPGLVWRRGSHGAGTFGLHALLNRRVRRQDGGVHSADVG